MSTIYHVQVHRIDGTPTMLDAYRGDVLLIVNVASRCELTSQYEGLERLYQTKWEQGLQVLGFPANNFAGQEPGTDEEISSFCTLNYDVHFPMFSKLSVRGDDQHPLYAELTKAKAKAIGDGPLRQRLEDVGLAHGRASEVLWNFEKFLVNRQGQVVARFAPDVTADDPRLLEAIDEQLLLE